MSKVDDRRALKSLSVLAQRVLSVFQQFETLEFVAVPELCLALEQTPLQLLAFSCLGTFGGKEELRLDIWETLFFKRFRKQLGKFLLACAETGISIKLSVILPDTEPVETWEWRRPQESVTDDCRLIAECAEGLPPGCEVWLWSDLLLKTGLNFASTHEWVVRSGPELIIGGEAAHVASSRAFDEIKLNASPRQVAERQVAAYALQGKVLEQLFPNAIFLQSETPAARKDVMYNPLRRHPLPIIHPFPL